MSKYLPIPAAALCLMLGLPGCILDDSVSKDNNLSVGDGEGEGDEQGEDFDRDDCKIEDGNIGIENLALPLGDVEVIFHDWVTKDGEPGEYVGFSITVNGAAGLSYVVKAGGETFAGEETTWMHPAGTGGPTVSAISHVDFCDAVPVPEEPAPEPVPEEPAPEEPAPEPVPEQPAPGCTDNSECPAGEFCSEEGTCEPIVIE